MAGIEILGVVDVDSEVWGKVVPGGKVFNFGLEALRLRELGEDDGA
jgi:hypothetical protein